MENNAAKNGIIYCIPKRHFLATPQFRSICTMLNDTCNSGISKIP